MRKRSARWPDACHAPFGGEGAPGDRAPSRFMSLYYNSPPWRGARASVRDEFSRHHWVGQAHGEVLASRLLPQASPWRGSTAPPSPRASARDESRVATGWAGQAAHGEVETGRFIPSPWRGSTAPPSRARPRAMSPAAPLGGRVKPAHGEVLAPHFRFQQLTMAWLDHATQPRASARDESRVATGWEPAHGEVLGGGCNIQPLPMA